MRDTMSPIRTMFNGIEYRSRLEANVAQMLCQLGITSEYEPTSFLLDDGTHYRPDFWCPEIRLWVEVRGYSNQRGDRQIRQFGEAVMDGRLRANKILMPRPLPGLLRPCGHPRSEGCPDDCMSGEEPSWPGALSVDYIVLSPCNVTRFFEIPNFHTCEGRDTRAIVCLCRCGVVYFASLHNDWRCRVCGASDKRYHLTGWAEIYLDEFGRPRITDEWYDRARNKLLSAERTVVEWLDHVRSRP